MAQKQEINAIFQSFKNALNKLEEALLLEDETDIKRDAVIQRFEFTYELLWKLYKKVAKEDKVDAFSPKKSFQYAFRLNLIFDEELYIEIIEARNKTSYVYSEDMVIKIYEFIEEKVFKAFVEAKERLEKFLSLE